MSHCMVCGDSTDRPIAAALDHFRLYERGQWRFFAGNRAVFGFWSAVQSQLCLSFPIYNTLCHWKYRKHRLVIPEGAAVCVTYGTTDSASSGAKHEG